MTPAPKVYKTKALTFKVRAFSMGIYATQN